MRSRRHVRRPPDLTSLFDVLFIVVFAALIRAAAVENAAAHPPEPPRPHAHQTPPAVTALRAQALADLEAALAARAPLVVRITRDGTIDGLDVDGKHVAMLAPLIERSADPNVAMRYVGERSPELQVCRMAMQQLGIADLSRYLVIMAPAVTPRELPDAAYYGLRRDVDRCQSEQHGVAVLIDPTALAPPPPPAPIQPGPTTPPTKPAMTAPPSTTPPPARGTP